jgi:hypothetical protein
VEWPSMKPPGYAVLIFRAEDRHSSSWAIVALNRIGPRSYGNGGIRYAHWGEGPLDGGNQTRTRFTSCAVTSGACARGKQAHTK